jgi:hypothetical protein
MRSGSRFLDDDCRFRELPDVAAMVKVKVADNHIRDVVRLQADLLQPHVDRDVGVLTGLSALNDLPQ